MKKLEIKQKEIEVEDLSETPGQSPEKNVNSKTVSPSKSPAVRTPKSKKEVPKK